MLLAIIFLIISSANSQVHNDNNEFTSSINLTEDDQPEWSWLTNDTEMPTTVLPSVVNLYDQKIENDETEKWMSRGGRHIIPKENNLIETSEDIERKKVDLNSGDANNLDDSKIPGMIDGENKYQDKLAEWRSEPNGAVTDQMSLWNSKDHSKLSSRWSEVNLTANASTVIPSLTGRNLIVLNPLKSFLNKIMKSFWSERIIQQKQPRCNFSSGSFINLCGECVGGKTEKEATYGMDGCGVCDGICPKQSSDNCSTDQVLNCTRVERIEPRVLDLAGDALEGFVVRLGSECSGACVVPPEDQLECYLSTHDDKILEKKTIVLSEDETVFKVKLSRPDREGSYKLCCGEDSTWCKPVIVVDSNRLIVNVKQADLRLSKEKQITLTVSNLEAQVGLVCFVKSGSHLLQAKFTNELYGNKFSTRVICPPFAPEKLGELNVGVAYSFRAIDKLTGISVRVSADSPRMERVRVRQDLSGMDIEFNQNIGIRIGQTENQIKLKGNESAPVTPTSRRGTNVDCAKIFTKESLSTFGRGPKCQVFLNKISIDYGKRPKLNQGMKVILAKKNIIIPGDISTTDISSKNINIPSASSAGVMKISLPKKIVKTGGRVVVEETCGSVRAAVLPLQQDVVYKWSLGIGNQETTQIFSGLTDQKTIEHSTHGDIKKRSTDNLMKSEFEHYPEIVEIMELFKRIKNNSPRIFAEDLNNKYDILKKLSQNHNANNSNVNYDDLHKMTSNTNQEANHYDNTTQSNETLPLITHSSIINETSTYSPNIDEVTTLKQAVELNKESKRISDKTNNVHYNNSGKSDKRPNLVQNRSANIALGNRDASVDATTQKEQHEKSDVIKHLSSSNNTMAGKQSDGSAQAGPSSTNLDLNNAEKSRIHRKELINATHTGKVVTKTKPSVKKNLGAMDNVKTFQNNQNISHFTMPVKSQELIDENIIKLLEEDKDLKTKSFKDIHKDTITILDEIKDLNEVIDKKNNITPLKSVENDFIEVDEFIRKYDDEGGMRLSAGQTQRRNLLIWKSVRKAEKQLKQGSSVVYINKTLLIPGVEYTVKAEALIFENNNTEIDFEDGKLITVGRTSGVLRGKFNNHVLHVVAPVIVNPLASLILQARTGDCTPEPSSAFKYEWKIEGNGSSLPTEGYRGSTFRIKRGILEPNTIYNITVYLYNALDTPTSWGSSIIYTEKGKLNERLPIKELSLGTAYPIMIDAKEFLPDDLNLVQIEWTCQTTDGDRCVKAGPSREVVTKQTGYVLNYPRGTLPVGQYKISAKGQWKNEEVWSTHVLVNVLRGDTPNLQVSLGEGGWTAKVTHSRPGCFLSWYPIPTRGCQTIHSQDLGQSMVAVENEAEIVLEIEKAVEPDNCYRLDISAECRDGKANVMLFVDSRNIPVTSLQVTPKTGQAMSTKFHYNIKPMAQRDIIEYKFGYQNDRGRRIIHTSLDDPIFYIYLPKGDDIVPFVELCTMEDECYTAYGEKMKVTNPARASKPALDEIILRVEDEINSKNFESSLGNMQLLAEGLGEGSPSHELYNASLALEYILANAMFDTAARISKREEQLWGAKLLQMITTVKFLPMTEKFTSILLDFRDRLGAAVDNTTRNQDKESATTEILKTTLSPLPSTTIKETSTENKKKPTESSNAIESSTSSTKLPGGQTNEPTQMPRVKRESGSKDDIVSCDIVDIVSTLMQTSQLFILSSKNKTKATEEKKKFLSNIQTYSVELCNQASDTNPVVAGSMIATLSGEKIHPTGQKQEIVLPPCSGTCMNETLQVVIGKAFADMFKSRDGICMTGAYLPRDLLDQTDPMPNKLSVSGVYRVDVLPFSGQLVTRDQTPNYLKKPLVIRIPIRVNLPHLKYQCEMWNSSMWAVGECKTVKQKTYKTISRIVCRCPWPAFYRVVVIDNSSSSSLNYSSKRNGTSRSTSYESVQLYTLTFLLKNDYLKEVYGRKIEFETMLKKQINSQADLPTESEVFTENQGNILVVLRAVDKWVNNETHFARVLSQKLTSGKLQLTGLSGANLTLDVMSFNFTHVPIGEKMAPPILLTMITTIFTVVFLVAALIALGAYIHYRKDIRTLNISKKPFDRSPKQKYCRLQDVASIENIEQALMKGRTNVDSGLILSVSGVKQSMDHESYQSKDIDYPTSLGTI